MRRRVMELAVALSKYVGEGEPLPLIADFVAGYVQRGQLSEVEAELLPDLINLRIFSNVIYFTGRALAGEDGIESLTTRADSYAKRVRWVDANRGAIVAAVKERMAVLAAA
jgi:Ser/Thr protein kinase RdoA (MazF antagonist)